MSDEAVGKLGSPKHDAASPRSHSPNFRSHHSSLRRLKLTKSQSIGNYPVSESAVTSTLRWQKDYGRRLLFLDAIVICIAVLFAQWFRFPFVGAAMVVRFSDEDFIVIPYSIVSVIFIISWIVGLTIGHTRSAGILGAGPEEYTRVVNASTVSFGIIALICVLFRADLSRTYILVAYPLGLVLLVFARWVARNWLQKQRSDGKYMHRVALAGYSNSLAPVLENINNYPASGFSIRHILTLDNKEQLETYDIPFKVISDLTSPQTINYIFSSDIDTVIYTGGGEYSPAQLRELGWQLQRRNMTLIVLPDVVSQTGPRTKMRRMYGLSLVYVQYPDFSRTQKIIKRTIDIVGAIFGLIILSPFFLLVSLLIKFTSTGPVFFKQRRVGFQGKTFKMWKFRTMRNDAETRLASLQSKSDGNGVQFKMKDDPRITWIGRGLRRHSLDEFPQLVNVLRGEMSLVGPRPALVRELVNYESRDFRRFLVKPGMTGLWQINGRSDLSWDAAIDIDLFYVENWSVLLDAMIVMRTARVVIKGEGAY